MQRPRVVVLPGILGSVLVDGSLANDVAREICADNLGVVGKLLRGSALYPCDKRPQTLWGGVGSLHWLLAPSAWQARMTVGNGLDAPGPLRADGLFEVDVEFRGMRMTFKPYASLVAALETAGADVLVFPYDWRLGAHHNSNALLHQILTRWFGGRFLEAGRRPAEADRVTFIGHSMGGLVARYFLESPRLGRQLARRLITIGTPHMGAPHAYLHFAGLTVPFPENPFYRWAREVLQSEIAAAGTSRELSALVLPAPTQAAVFRFMAAALELMPVYDFVSTKGATESYRDTYAGLVHSGTGRPALELVDGMRRNLVRGTALSAWLGEHDIDYHFIAATGFPTVSGFDRGRRRILTTREGDGTVPLLSARPAPPGTPRIEVHTLAAHAYGHQRLCERPDVQALCLSLVALPRVPTTMGQGQATTEDFVAMACDVLQAHNVAPQRGVVLSVARLAAHDGAPLLDATQEQPAGSPRPRLRNPPKHLSSPDLFEVQSPRHGMFRYAWMLSNENASFPVGGLVFVPMPAAPDLHIVTFNVGPLDTSVRTRCRNAHHAEVQLTRFVEEQPVLWRASIGRLQLMNRSRQGPGFGYSPCNACCDDLAIFLASLNALPRARPPVDAEISWERLYDKGQVCGHATDAANLQRLVRNGWKTQGPQPSTPRQAPPRPVPAGVP